MSSSLRPHGLYSPWNFSGQNTGMGCLSVVQGIFPTQGLNPGLPHCRQILYQLSHKGNPVNTWIWIWRISLIGSCQKQEKEWSRSHLTKIKIQRWEGFWCLLKSCFHFLSSSELAPSPSENLLLLFQITFCVACLFSSWIKFHVTPWMAGRGSKSGSSMPSSHCAFFFFFIYLGFYIMTQGTLCRTKWPFLLSNQRESFGCIAKVFLRNLLQIYILVLSNRLKITGLLYNSPFCPYFSTHLTGMNVQCWET